MSTLVLLRNEAIKGSRRIAVWVGFAALVGITGMGAYANHRASTRPENATAFALPEAWPRLFELAQVSFFFLAVLLVLLVASEYSWKTARQNVIDGLSKEQFFLGKLLLLPILAALLLVLMVVIGGVGAAWGETFPTTVLRASDARMAAAGALGLLGFGSFALLFATAIRSTGSALGAFFLYAAILERLVGGSLGMLSERLEPVVNYLPVAIFMRLVDPIQWDPAALARATARLAEIGATPHVMPTGTLVGAAAAYTVVFIVAAFLVFRARDL